MIHIDQAGRAIVKILPDGHKMRISVEATGDMSVDITMSKTGTTDVVVRLPNRMAVALAAMIDESVVEGRETTPDDSDLPTADDVRGILAVSEPDGNGGYLGMDE